MNEEQIKKYYGLCNDLWKYFKKYSAEGITDTNIWQAMPEADDLKMKHCCCIGYQPLIDDVVRQLQEIGEPNNRNGGTRADQFFKRAAKEPNNQTKWNVVGQWMEWYTLSHPGMADYITNKLQVLLMSHGYHIGLDELKDYAHAGWSLAFRPKEGD